MYIDKSFYKFYSYESLQWGRTKQKKINKNSIPEQEDPLA